MTVLARKNGVRLGRKGQLYVVEYRTGSLILTDKVRANEVYDALSK